MRELTTDELLARFAQGDRRACGQVMSRVENDSASSPGLLHRLYSRVGRAYRVGVTGPPGAGKSTLVAGLAGEYRRQGLSVGIIATDPTSPFSGGAILGDRIRMSALFTDPAVFIRSMGSRGSLGGLALKTKEVCDVLDAFGRDVILIETIGVGQVELDIAAAAYTTVVVLVPESGDAIQAMKAGLMEVGDLFVINKSDREGADRMALEVEAVLGMRNWPDGWRPRVIKTVATGGLGVPELAAALAEHRTCLSASGALAQKRLGNVRREVIELVNLRVEQDFWQNPRVGRILEHGLDRIARGEATPYQVADELIRAGKES